MVVAAAEMTVLLVLAVIEDSQRRRQWPWWRGGGGMRGWPGPMHHLLAVEAAVAPAGGADSRLIKGKIY